MRRTIRLLFQQVSQPVMPILVAPSAPDVDKEQLCSMCERYQKILVCYTPKNANGVVSCVLQKNNDPLVFTTDERAAIVPAGSIIDSIEFFGIDYLITKEAFSIGLGQLNQDISFPLIVDTDTSISNERVGGCRDFVSYYPDGHNEKKILLCDNNVNVALSNPITSGYLQIVIKYHHKVV